MPKFRLGKPSPGPKLGLPGFGGLNGGDNMEISKHGCGATAVRKMEAEFEYGAHEISCRA